MFANMSILYHIVSLIPSQAHLIHKLAEISPNDMSLYTINVDLVKGARDSEVYSPETPVGQRLRVKYQRLRPGSFKFHT
jgi:hypothetical protein